MERVLVALAAFLCCLEVGDAQTDFSPMISEEAINLTNASDISLLECNSSSEDLVGVFGMNEDDIVWLSIPSSDLSMATATNCSMAEELGSGSDSDDFSALADGLVVLANGSMYNVSTAVLPNGGYVICVVNDTDLGMCRSNFTTITVAPTVDLSDSRTFNRGEDVVLNCSAITGGPELTFQWQFNGEILTDETSSNLTILNINTTHGGTYNCSASNNLGSDSDSTVVSVAPYFTVSPKDTVGSNGTNLELNCEAEAFPPELQYQWIRVDVDIRSEINANSSVLSFSPTQFGDEGNYACMVTSNGIIITSDNVSLTLSPQIRFITEERSYNRSDNIVLTCLVQGGPENSFQWQFNGTELPGEMTENLTISNVNASNGGMYTCVVTNAAGNRSADTSVFILPYFTLQPHSVGGTNGSRINLTCGAEAFPSPSYEWIRVGETIRSDLSINSESLVLDPLLFGDEGDYVCNVNSSGTIISSNSATISVSPEGSVAAMPPSINSQMGASVTLSCMASGGPENNFVWVRSPDGFVVGNQSVVSITINNSLDGGVYLCNVSNLAGFDSDDSTVNVSPSIDVPPMNMTIAAQENTSFTCTASGFPAPSIVWNYEGAPLSNVSIVSTMVLDSYRVQSNLSIVLANVSDTGTYTCIAYSPVDNTNDSETAMLIVQAVPLQPVITEVFNISSRSLSLKWAEPPINNAPIQFYLVTFMNPPFVSEDTTVINTTQTTVDIEFLFPGIEYVFTVVAVNDIGESRPSDERRVRTIEEAPDEAPANVTAEPISPTSIYVTWEELPLINRNGDIVYELIYIPLETFEGTYGQYSLLVNTTNLTLTDLEESVEFNISVRALTAVGNGPFSNPVAATTFEAAPLSPPSNVIAMASSSTSIEVMWNEVPPIDQNGIITDYEVVYTPLNTFGELISSNSTNVSGSELSVSLVNLEEYVNYSISVTAYTSVGAGPASENIITLTLQAAPASPPTNVNVTVTSPTTVNVVWNRVLPIDENGIITMYEILYTPLQDFGGLILANATNVSELKLSVSLENLQEYVNYSISVRAYTEVGPGPGSDDITVLTLEAAPASPPTNVNVTVTSPTTVLVTWNRVLPIDENGIITTYEVLYTPLQDFGGQISANTTNVSGSNFLVSLEYLQEYVNYSISVRAYTEVGPGPRSDDITVLTLEAVPASPPSNLTVMALSPRSINVTWNEVPPIDQNGIITFYEILYLPLNNFDGLISSNSTNVSGSDLSVILIDLEEYVNYSISVRAYTGVGPGPNSTAEIELTLEDAPSNSPANVRAMASSSTSILVTWNEVPPIDQNGVIIAYEVMYSQLSDSGGIVFTNLTNVSGSEFSITLLYLEEYVNYSISVRAYTNEGPGPFSDAIVELTLEDIPSAAPRNFSAVSMTSTSIFVQWETIEILERNGEIIVYEVEYTPLETFGGIIGQELVNVSGQELSVNLTGLEEFVNYTMSVRAYTSVGAGPGSAEVVVRTLPSAPSSPPVNTTATVNSSSIIVVSWEAVPPMDQNGIIDMYQVMYSPMETFNGSIGQNITNVSAAELSVTLEDLEEFVNYSIIVRAFNSEGPSNFSDGIMQQTLEDAPNGFPTITNTSVLSMRSVFVQWTEVPLILQNGIITDYTVSLVPNVTANQPRVNEITSNLTITVDGLVPNTMYNISVTAATRIGPGPSSALVEVETPPDRPDAVPEPPEVPADAINATSVTLTWEAPPMPNGVITGYTVELFVLTDVVAESTNSRRKRATALSVNEACIPGGRNRSIQVDASRTSLTVDAASNVNYQFRVQASTDVGSGEFSTPRNFSTPFGAPDPVRSLSGTPTSNSIEVTWNIPLCPNGEITGYNLYHRQSDTIQTGTFMIDNSYMPVSLSASSRSHTIMDLQPFRNYTIIVRAMVGDNVGEIDVEMLVRTLSDIAPTPTLGVDRSTSQPPTRNQIPYLIPGPGQINTGTVILCVVVVVEGQLSGLSTYDQAQPYAQDSDFYITAAWGENDIATVPRQIVIGDEQVYQVVFSGNTVRYTNVPLKAGTQYNFFTRYDIRNENNDNQPFRVYSEPVVIRTQSPSPVGAVVGSLFAIIIVAVIVAVIVVLLVWWYRRGGFAYSKRSLEDAEHSNNVELVQASFIKNHGAVAEEDEATTTVATHDPVPIEAFGKYVKQHHGEDNELFSDEYKEVEPKHSPTANHTRNPDNIQKNRYANITAYDHSRVKLELIPGEANSDYINANYLDGYKKKNCFIAAQGPVPASVCDFWRMIWEQKVEYIVMVTNCEEKGRVKCHQYWPENSGTPAFYSPFHIYLQESLVLAEYTIRTLSLQKEGSKSERIVRQFHFTVWPDHGVPEYPSQLLHFVRKVMQEEPMKNGPMVVHCSAGVGRTGTFITLFAQLQRIRAERTVDVFNFVQAMRYRRCYMVQTEDQYVFIHDSLLEAIECGVTEVPARDVLKRYKRLSNPEPGRPGMKEEFTKVSRTIHHQIFRTFSMMPAHKIKNRYNDSNLLPYDKTSVRLPSKTSGTDYINANYVDGYHKQRAYIATQGPLPETVDDFWKMVWDQKTTTIVMLVKEKELGRVKCHKYWPEKGAMNAEDLQVILHNETEFPDYVVREFKLVDSSDGASSQIKQFHFKDWPEDPDQTPDNSSGLIDLIGQVQKWQIVSGDHPIVVHCSDGCGRTGVYLAISILLERLKNEGVVDVFQTVRTLRLQRPQTVANLAQYEFCYKTVLEFLDSFELYSNFK